MRTQAHRSSGTDSIDAERSSTDGSAQEQALKPFCERPWSKAFSVLISLALACALVPSNVFGQASAYADEATQDSETQEASLAAQGSSDKELATAEEEQDATESAVSLDTVLDVAVSATSSTSVKVSWSQVTGAEGYSISYKQGSNTLKELTVAGASSTSQTISVSANQIITVKVAAYATSEGSTLYGPYSSEASCYTGVVSSPSSTMSAASKITITYAAVSGATGYQIRYRLGSGSWNTVNAGTATSKKLSSLTTNKTLQAQVRAYKKADGSNVYGPWSSSVYRYTGKTAKLTSTMNMSKKKLTISWAKYSASSGSVSYMIKYRASGGSWKKLTTTSTSKTISVSSGKYYQVRVYPVVKVDGRSYSGVCSTSRRLSSAATPKAAWNGSKLKVSTTKVSKVTGYEIRYSTSKSFSSYKTKKTKSTSVNISGLDTLKTQYVKVRAYRVVNGATYTGPWSGAKKVAAKPSTKSKMVSKAQSYSSKTKYLILVNKSAHKVAVFKGSKNNWSLQHYWDCVTGKSSTPTITGSFYTTGYKKGALSTDSRAKYCTQIRGGYFFHTILASNSELGQSLSHGCIRLSYSSAKWIYKNIKGGTRVVIY